jgi:large subunit ribosomal protein L29
MNTKDLRDLDQDKLYEQIGTLQRDLFGLRMQHATGELENTARLAIAKRDLARALTVAREQDLAEYYERESVEDGAEEATEVTSNG